MNPWLDHYNLLPGQDWNLEITKAVKNSDIVIVFISQDSISKSGYIQKEIKFAIDVASEQPEEKIFLIPARIEKCNVPQSLSKWQYVDLFSPDGYDRLLNSLKFKDNV